MNNFTVTNFAEATNPEPQKSGYGSGYTEYEDRVVCTIGARPQNSSTFSRLKYRLAEPYKRGDDFWVWQDFELPENFYDLQNGSMRLIGLWNNPENGRLGLWIDSDQCPRLQVENKSKRLISPPLWRGDPKQYPTGRHKLSLHIILGELTELFIDGQVVVSVEGDNMPYDGYTANQIIFMFDGANANTRAITATCYEIGARPSDVCRDLELTYISSEVGLENATIARDEAHNIYILEQGNFEEATTKRNNALEAWNECKGSQVKQQ